MTKAPWPARRSFLTARLGLGVLAIYAFFGMIFLSKPWKAVDGVVLVVAVLAFMVMSAINMSFNWRRIREARQRQQQRP